jgi:NodT family efflux transporter outer membrane factor (OMF) lipoprotein
MKPDSSPFVSQLKRRPTPHPRAIPSSRLSRLCSVGLAAVDRFTPSAPATTTESGPLGLPGGDAQTLEIGQDLDAQWWTLFHCPELDALAAQAIRANPDLASARAALKAAQAEVRVQAAGYFPTADLSSQASREKDSTTLSPTLNSPIERFSLYTAQLSIAYSPDVFGGVRRTVENAKALAEQQRYELEASYLTITTNVANAVIQAAALKAEIDANQRLVDIGRDLLNLYRQEKALGQLAQADVAGQIAQLAQAEAQLLPLRRQLAQQQDLIADLTGRTPAEYAADPIPLSALSLPSRLPVSLPSKLVEQRPDIRAAEANLHAASAAVGIAIAARLPTISLGATGGGASTGLGSVLTPANQFWTLTGGFTQPIFEGGQLLAKQREAEAQLDQAKAQYRSTVLSAFQNVADSLQAVEIDAQALRAAAQAERASLQSMEIARDQQRLGQISGAQVLITEQVYQTALQAEVQAQAARYSDTVALFQALGGGWWNRKGPA